MLAARRALPRATRELASARICTRLAELPELAGKHALAGFMPLPDEVDILPFLDSCARRLRPVGIPAVAAGQRTLRWHNMSAPGFTLHTGYGGIREPCVESPSLSPAEFAAALVPSVAVDNAGNRLGFGRGFYDKNLPQMENALLIAPVFECQLCAGRLPVAAHDRKVDMIVTECRIVRAHERCR